MQGSDLNFYEETYVEIVRGKLEQLEEDTLLEDIDLICQYVVLRFLKTSSVAHAQSTQEEVEKALGDFMSDLLPFLMTFVAMANCLPLVETEGNDA